jgi:hypothetical protein
MWWQLWDILMAGLASDGGDAGFIPEGNRDRPRWHLAAATSRRHCLSPSLVIVGDKQMN